MFKKSWLALFFLPLFLQAQQRKPFKITGKSDYYNNSELYVVVGTFPLFINDCTLTPKNTDSLYYPKTLVQNGGFEFNGTLRYPHPLSVSYYDVQNNHGNTSDFYFIDGGEVHISVDDLAKNRALGSAVNNKSNQEYRRLKKLYSALVDTVTHRVTDIQAKQRLMKTYIVQHPNSYVALWELLFDYGNSRNDSVKGSILANTQLFSPLVKKSNTYQALLQYLNKDLELVAGRQFPDINLKPAVSIRQTVKENKFILIDFWFSHCEPCLKQLPDLKEIYAAYKEKNFSIIGISVDSKANETYWQKTIEKYSLNWPQYLDENGREAQRLNVNVYPSNFLLDGKGLIIKKDISPAELNEFLQKNLNR